MTADLLLGLTEEQGQAVTAPAEGRLKIVAGAGSGKTEVLTRRVAGLLRSGIRPRELVAITYTRKAAAEMKQRLVEKRGLSPRLFHEMEVNTFHGFLAHLLRRDPFSAGIDGADATLTETTRLLLLEEVRETFETAFTERLISPEEGFDPSEAQALVHEFPRTLGKIRRFLLGPADFQAAVRRAAQARGGPLSQAEERVANWLHRFYMMYLAALQDRHLMDFDEILMRGEALVREWQETGLRPGARVFLIDEFQDNNREQLRIVERLLAGRNGHLTVVGDFRQSIYRFQGADLTAFTGFAADREIVLRENFRSCQEIIDLANAFIAPGLPSNLPPDQIAQIARLGPSRLDRPPAQGGSSDPTPTSPPPWRPEGEPPGAPSEAAQPGPPAAETLPRSEGLPAPAPARGARPFPIACLLTGSDHPREHAGALAAMIHRLVDGRLARRKDGRPMTYGDVAVIVPSIRRLPASFEDPFLERGIPYQMSGGLGFYDRSEIAEMVAFLRLLANPYHDHSLVKIFTGPLFGLSDSELTTLAASANTFRNRAAAGEEGGPAPLWVRLEERLRADPDSLPDRARRFCRFFAELQTRRLTMTVLDLVYHLVEEAGFREYVAGQRNDLRRRRMENNLAKFIGIVRGFEQSGVFTTLHDFLAWHDRVLASEVQEEEAGLGLDERGAVKIMTIHKAKGLEFPLVCMPDLKAHRFSARDRIGFSREEGLLVKPLGKGPFHPPCNAFLERERSAAGAEDRRKLYVAMTRAEELLVFTGAAHRAEDPDEPLQFIRTFLETHPDHGTVTPLEEAGRVADAWLAAGACPPGAPTESPGPSGPPDLGELCGSMSAVRSFLERPALPPPRAVGEEVFSLGDLDQFTSCPRRYFFTRQHLAPLVTKEVSRGTVVGNLVHQALRIFHAAPAGSRPSLPAVLDRLATLHGPSGAEARPLVGRILDRYLASPLAHGPVWLVEAEVNLRLEGSSGPFLLRGFADRVDRDGSDIQLIDYKTHGYSEAAHSHYARQMALYLAAAQRGILGDLGALNFPQIRIAYLTEHSVEVRPCEPDLVAFESWAVACVEAIRREAGWKRGPEAPCPDCGYLVLCGGR